MPNKIEIEKPNIFPDEVISGITLRNLENFPPYGFSISKGKIYSQEEIENYRKLLANEIGIEFQNLIFTHQTHTDRIAIISDNQKNNIEADGLITNKAGFGIVISLADCCGIALYDRKKKIIAAVHSGWRGTNLNITSKAIGMMIEQFHSEPQDILAYISPCAGSEGYEVGDDVAVYFPKYIRKISEKKYLLDLKQAILEEIITSGIPNENIEISGKSTISNNSYHSFRRDKDNSGRMGLFIALKAASS